MKPLNLDNRPCSPISSNCVIWQGPDIPCIKLCTGDTVSDVIEKLATELCAIMDTLKITNYDLSCFNLMACPPDDFQKLIQLLIDRVCAIENINNSEATGSSTPRGLRSTSTCPDCVVTVAEPFVVGTQTTMQLVEYVNMIGQKITSIIDEILNLQIQITDLLVRVTAIENTPSPVTPTPTIVVGCNIGTLIAGNSYTIDNVLDQLINSVASGYCSLLGVLGTPADIGNALVPACAFGTDVTTDPNWTPVPATLAESITNAWIVICDVYAAVSTGLVSTNNTSSVNLDLTAGVLTANIQDTGWVDLDGFAWYGTYNIANKKVPQCRRMGNAIHFRGTVMVPLQDPLNGNQPLIWDYKGSAPLTDTYFLNTTVAPSQAGPGSVVLNPGGSITFNQGNSVIPTSIVDSGTNFDNNYALNYTLSYRYMPISLVPIYSGMLTTLVKPYILSNKTLMFQLIKDYEASAGGTAGNPYSTSLTNNLISHVRSGEYVPQYASASSVMNSSPASGVQPVELDYDPALTYPFTCDANDETNLGGFGWVELDGLIAYLDPCTTDIKNYSCP